VRGVQGTKSGVDSMKLYEHAEAWQRERGKPVPERYSKEWRKMYEEWAVWSFRDLPVIEL